MPIKFKVITLHEKAFEIEPMRAPELHQSYSGMHSDLSMELSQLKRELAQAPIGLVENADYSLPKGESYIPHHYRIRFDGPSLVVRAMHSIPEDRIAFESSYGSYLTSQKYKQYLILFSYKITAKECFAHDLQFVLKASHDCLMYLQSELAKAHAKFTQSEVMRRLDEDLDKIDHLQNENYFDCSKYLMAVASLVVAYKTEKDSPSQFNKTLGIFKSDSTLAPEYQRLFKTLQTLTPFLDESHFEKWNQIYNKYVRNISANSSPSVGLRS
jgi:hypothetical protein